MHKHRHRFLRGFSLTEVVVVVAIFALIATVSMSAFKNMYIASVRNAGASEVFTALTTARNKTLASEGDMVHGVHISSTTVTRFEGSTYVPGAATNLQYSFEGGVSATSSLITNGIDISFARLTGAPSATGTIYIRNSESNGTTTLVIYASGLVEYQ